MLCTGPDDDETSGDEGDDDDNDDDDANKGSSNIVLEVDDDNLPLIPHYKKQGLALRKEIIRKYVTGHYRMSVLGD